VSEADKRTDKRCRCSVVFGCSRALSACSVEASSGSVGHLWWRWMRSGVAWRAARAGPELVRPDQLDEPL